MVDRFIVCHNHKLAERDAAVRESLVGQLAAKIERSDALSKPQSTRTRLASPAEKIPNESTPRA